MKLGSAIVLTFSLAFAGSGDFFVRVHPPGSGSPKPGSKHKRAVICNVANGCGY